MTGLAARARRFARVGLGRTLRVGTAPVRGLARAAIRRRPALEASLADQAWLWQPGWGRGRHERLYRTPDPYGLATDAYERSKYDLIVQTLAGGTPGRTLEVGCGEGVLSARLAELSHELLGVDISEVAVQRARGRLAGDGRARFERRTLPLDMPDGTFDLIVCSDVLYYWEPATLRTGMSRLLDRLRPGGRLLLLHYLGDFGQAGDGDAVHDLAARRCAADRGLRHLVEHRRRGAGPGGAGVRLDVLGREPVNAPASPPQRSPSGPSGPSS